MISLYNEHGTQLSPSGEEWKRLGVQWIELPFKNFVESPSIENLRKGIEIIELYAGLEKTVYIHCRDGRSRSATLAACYLIKVNSSSVRYFPTTSIHRARISVFGKHWKRFDWPDHKSG